MAYVKKLIDNTTCSRRFHITFDDNDKRQQEVKLDCPFCGVTIFKEKDHPPVNLARQENLVQTAELSDDIISECNFEDKLSQKTTPGYKQPAPH